MKKHWFHLGLAVMLAAALTLPAQRALGSEVLPADAFVYDAAGLLTGEEEAGLSALGAAAAEQYGCGLYIVTVDSYLDLDLGMDIDTTGDNLYGAMGLGVGDGDSGCLLMLSMQERQYVLVADGCGNTAFTDYGKEYLADAFLDDFGDDDWYGGFADYMETAGEMLETARAGEPVDVGYDDGSGRIVGIALCVLLGLAAAFIVRGVLRRQLKSVADAGEARFYVNQAGTDMDVVRDRYTHTTQSRIYDPPQKSSGGSGGGTTIGSSGRSTSSGSF